MIDKNLIISVVEEKLKGTNYYLTDVNVTPDNVISVEIDNDNYVNIDDCVNLSRYIEQQFDREKEDYELEVSSAGITSPFKTYRQYIKNVGKEIETILNTGKELIGVLKHADEQMVTITVKKKVNIEGTKQKKTVTDDVTYNYNEIKQTKYLLRF